MTNLERYNKAFLKTFPIKKEDLPGFAYQKNKYWDSFGHMDLVSALEEYFDIRMETLDVLEFNTYEKGKEVLLRYGVEIEEE